MPSGPSCYSPSLLLSAADALGTIACFDFKHFLKLRVVSFAAANTAGQGMRLGNCSGQIDQSSWQFQGSFQMTDPTSHRVLLVEDNQAIAELTSEMLQMLGHEVVVAHSVAEARSQLGRHEITFILLDYRLPDGPGLALLPQLPDPLINQVAVVTAHDAESLPAERLKGVSAVLCKPVEFAELKALLGNHAGKRQG